MLVAHETLLRAYCLPRADVLWSAGIPYPWPEDLAPAIIICSKCGKDERSHVRCPGCGILIGDGHIARHDIHTGHCAMCGNWMIDHPREPVPRSDSRQPSKEAYVAAVR